MNKPAIFRIFIVMAFVVGQFSFAMPPTPVHAAYNGPVTVTIFRLNEIDQLDGGLFSSFADFYAGVTIDGVRVDNFATHRDFDFEFGVGLIFGPFDPGWAPLSRTINTTADTANVSIEIWDHDDCSAGFCSDDEQADADPGPDKNVDLVIDLATGRWTGDQNWPDNCSIGTSPALSVCWEISRDSASGDADGDGLLDGWERNGFNANNDSVIDLDLPAMGANPLRRDLFLEIDCLVAPNHTHCPLQGALQTVVQSFADAPVNNADNTTGVQLHIDIGNLYGQAPGAATNVLRTGAAPGGVTGSFGNFGGGGSQIGEAGNLVVDWDGAAGRPATDFFILKSANFNSVRDAIFRYAIFVHQTNARAAANDCTSGWAKGIPGVNFLVSLGGTNGGSTPAPCWGTDAGGNSVGSQNEQAGTLQHEFGHVLGLGHGGGDGINNKPNYLSAMNYSFQMCQVTRSLPALPGGCDYSRQDLPDLNEVNPPGLDECVGIGGGLGLGSVNWDGDLLAGAANLEGVTNCQPPNSANVSANINGDYNDANGNDTQDPGEADTFGTLTGYDDWNNLVYNFRTLPNFQSAGVPVENEPDPTTIEQARAHLAQLLQPVLLVDKTGPSDALPGDTLTYSTKVKNTGNGPALDATLTETAPDATQAVLNLGIIPAAAEVNPTSSFAVPCSTADLTVLTDSAAVTAADMLGNLVSGADSLQTTVHAPVVTLSKTAAATAAAGEAILYTLTYANTGSGGATNVVIADTLPAGVYYSNALNLGAGPQPTTVTVNGDGTSTLTWQIAVLAANSGPQTIQFTARPSLLFRGGELLNNSARLTFQNPNGCNFNAAAATAATTLTTMPPTRNPATIGFWRNHVELWSAEILARIQATDQRYDTDASGALSTVEGTAMLSSGGNQPRVLQMQLLASYFNLATRRINAATSIASRTAAQLGLRTVAEAAIYAINTLALPVDSAQRARYDNATTVLDEINNNKSEAYTGVRTSEAPLDGADGSQPRLYVPLILRQ